jgi:hypothetical protein
LNWFISASQCGFENGSTHPGRGWLHTHLEENSDEYAAR